MSKNVLKVENATMQFGGVVAVNNLNMEINEGEIVALIGPNGAGKTTAFNVITGVYQPTNGAVWFNGEKIVENHPQGKMKKLYKGEHDGDYTSVLAPTPDKITKLGMARTFQNIRLWKSQTVFDNVLITDIDYAFFGNSCIFVISVANLVESNVCGGVNPLTIAIYDFFSYRALETVAFTILEGFALNVCNVFSITSIGIAITKLGVKVLFFTNF